MRKYVIIVLVISGIAFAHSQMYQGKSYTFHRDGHVIDIELDHSNTLKVNMDTVEIGTRTNFCTTID